MVSTAARREGDPGLIPTFSKCICSPRVKGGRIKLGTCQFKIYLSQPTQIEIKITLAVLPGSIASLNKHNLEEDMQLCCN